MDESWIDLGRRLAEARKDMRLTQQELAAAVGLERTAITKIESGQRGVDALELTRLAEKLMRPIGWFLSEPVRSLVSRRKARDDVFSVEDARLEALSLDVEQLIDLKLLDPPVLPAPQAMDSLEAVEVAAMEARRLAGLTSDEPAWDLIAIAEKLGLYAFSLPLEGSQLDGTYVALRSGGVALINGAAEPGRRRFTVAHELGHHFLSDEYAPEWVIGAGETEREKVINAFAVHFLLPRRAVESRWPELTRDGEVRDAAIRLAVDFGLSWSAVCAQLVNLRAIPRAAHDDLVLAPPRQIDFIERKLRVRVDVEPPTIPPGYAAAVIRAMRRHKIGRRRALELLHGALREEDLPEERLLPLEAMAADIEPLRR